THSGFLRLLRDRLVGEHPHPDLSAALDETRHRHARRFDLPVGKPARLERPQPVIAERHIGAAPGLSCHPAALLLPIFDLLGHQHFCIPRGAPPPLGIRRLRSGSTVSHQPAGAGRALCTPRRAPSSASTARPYTATSSRQSARTSYSPRRSRS